MELKLPYKWIKEYVKTDLSVSEFAKALSLHGPSIEKWHFEEILNDESLEIEVTTNRIDSASVIGVAREASAILKTDFLYKDPSLKLTHNQSLPLMVNILNKEKCKRYEAVVIDKITVKESPEWLRNRLESSGIKSINNIVDITNYVLLEHGQPMHAYDYQKLEGNVINIRLATQNETIRTLGSNEKTELSNDDLVISDLNSPVCIAGVKGGEKSGINFKTTTIVLESANFEPVSIRKTARKHDLITDASKLFEKGLPPEQTHGAMLRAIELILQNAGGEIVSDIIDIKLVNYTPVVINYNVNLTKRFLGIEIANSEVTDILARLGFIVVDKGTNLVVEVPYYRAKDVEFDYDLTEEIARIYGYYRIPSALPKTEIPVVKTANLIANEDQTREILSANGFTEVFTYSLISDKQLSVAEVSPKDTIELLNPLSNDFKYMRTELGSSILNASEQNEMMRDEIKLFEISNVYLKVSEKDLPNEESHLVILRNSTDFKKAFYEVKGIWEIVLQMFGVNLNDVEYRNEKVKEPLFIGRSANIYYKSEFLGSIGIISKLASKKLGLKKENALLEVDFVKLSKIFDETIKSFNPISKYPAVNRDLAFVIEKSIEWKSIHDLIKSINPKLIKSIQLFDTFEDGKLGNTKKSIAFHIILESQEKTLEDDEVNLILNNVISELSDKFKALQRE